MSADSPFDPENRELYTALVRPPDRYKFGHAVATTYSLDFETARKRCPDHTLAA
jgi:hypothetical protein